MVLRGTASKFETFVWILAITTNLNMIFCVVFIAWLNFETHPSFLLNLRTVPTIVIAHTFCASPDTRISYRQCLLIQGHFCAV